MPEEEDEGDVDEPVMSLNRKKRRRRQQERKKRIRKGQRLPNRPVHYAAAASQASEGHVDLMQKEALQQMIKEESEKRIVKAQEVRQSTGAELERWKLAAEAELSNNFVKQNAYHVSTKAEREAFGAPLPMLCVWSTDDAME